MCRPVGRPGSVWLGGPVAALRCLLLRRPHRVVEGTYQREHKEKDPRREGIGKVEDEEMKERRVIRPLAHRAEVAPAARAEREREVSMSVARGVARELGGERALLLVVVAPDRTLSFWAVRVLTFVVSIPVVVAAVRVEVGIALGLKGGEDGLGEGGRKGA